MIDRQQFARGFSLVELAVVLVIVALLTSGIMISLSAQQDLRQVADTQRQLSDIKESLLGFAAAYGRLPCPAKSDIATGQANAGKEDCTQGTGVLPWIDLGLAETDAWGRRFTYRATGSFRDPIADNTVSPPASCTELPTLASFALCSQGNITVSDGTATIADNLPVIVVSHGRNGRGAYLANGTQIPPAPGGDEEENSDNNATFVSHPAAGQGGANEYDDMATWVPLGILLNRMVAVGKLP